MKCFLAFASVALFVLGGSLAVTASEADAQLLIYFGCVVGGTSGSLDFTADQQAPGANSTGEVPCGMFWSSGMTFTLYANASSCWLLETTNFIHQVNSAWTLDASIDQDDCDRFEEWFLNWNVHWTKTETLKIGVRRSGYGDRAGTYIAEITILCQVC